MPRRVIALLTMVTAGLGCYAQPAPPSEFVPGLEVLHYDVELYVDFDALEITGRATVQVARQAGIRELRLGLDGPRVDSVEVAGQRTPLVQHRAELLVTLPSGSGDTLDVDVYYHGPPREGLYAGELDGERVVYTDGWPTRVAGWLPGIHHPAHPAKLSLSLRRAEGRVVAASGSLVEEDDDWSHWELTASAPTYSFAFAMGPYARERREEAALPIMHHVPRSMSSRYLDRASNAIAFMDSLLAPYPYGSFATAAVPFDFAGMENASCTFLSASLYGTPALEETLVHEVVHQWFGNRVTIGDWRDLWISEGTTTYLTTVFYEMADGEDVAAEMRADFAAVAADDVDAHRPLVPASIDSPYEMLSWLVYRKGAAVHHLLRLRLGEDIYFDLLRDIYASYEGRALSTESFIEELTQRVDEDLHPLVEYWIYGQRIPRLVTNWDHQARFLAWNIEGDEGTLEDVPLRLEVSTGGETWHVNALAGGVELSTATRPPTVRPVGVMMTVE